MARRKKKSSGGGGGDGWLVTFSDLMTLLLTFFVLLLSMASMDQVKITRMRVFSGDTASIEASGLTKASARIELLVKVINDPELLKEKQDLIKDLLFPDEVLPKDVERNLLEENLKVLVTEEGVAIMLTEKLLFEPGSAMLSQTAQTLLEQVLVLLLSCNTDVNVSGFSDAEHDVLEQGMDYYSLSVLRGRSVLDYFLAGQVHPDRFSLGGYGTDRPLNTGPSPADHAQNSRVEILLKTTRWVGQY